MFLKFNEIFSLKLITLISIDYYISKYLVCKMFDYRNFVLCFETQFYPKENNSNVKKEFDETQK